MADEEMSCRSDGIGMGDNSESIVSLESHHRMQSRRSTTGKSRTCIAPAVRGTTAGVQLYFTASRLSRLYPSGDIQ